ncbi:hypothetical protein AMC75_12075 [Staphylococcus carnosus]|uniref:hypothetical protein n=1 Tax=Staphylococcus carnosus TaxID=1281 RepID=UPI0006ABC867|nr:hypothetical protein [Staphylococcus carnosus]KOR11872.1 hypothetical protein AMC75_12075 [Staphylococcus carnosus]
MSQELQLYEDHINKILSFSNKKLAKNSRGYKIIDISDQETLMSAQDIKQTIDAPYVHELYERIKQSLNDGEYDSVITQCRTLIEEIYVYVLEMNDKNYKSNGNINKQSQEIKKY